MASLAELQAFKSALERARFSGVKVVEVGGRKTEYKSDTEMRQAMADLDRQIAAAQGGSPFGVIRITSNKGV